MTEFVRTPVADHDRPSSPAPGLMPLHSRHREAIGLAPRPMVAIVDDNEMVRNATLSLVNMLGYDAITFPSAELFLQSDQSHKASCLITDVQMPGLSGLDLQDRLIARGSAMPVIVVSGSLDGKIRSRAMRAGAFGCLTKPYPMKSLAKCLEMALKRPQGDGAPG